MGPKSGAFAWGAVRVREFPYIDAGNFRVNDALGGVSAQNWHHGPLVIWVKDADIFTKDAAWWGWCWVNISMGCAVVRRGRVFAIDNPANEAMFVLVVNE